MLLFLNFSIFFSVGLFHEILIDPLKFVVGNGKNVQMGVKG